MLKNKDFLLKEKTKFDRPLSPHLSVYKPQFTSVLSIFHRITGVALLFSLILALIWVLCIAISKELYILMKIIFLSVPIKILIFFTIFIFWYHFCTGIRHLIYDLGKGFEYSFINYSAYIIIFTSLSLSFLTYFLIYF